MRVGRWCCWQWCCPTPPAERWTLQQLPALCGHILTAASCSARTHAAIVRYAASVQQSRRTSVLRSDDSVPRIPWHGSITLKWPSPATWNAAQDDY